LQVQEEIRGGDQDQVKGLKKKDFPHERTRFGGKKKSPTIDETPLNEGGWFWITQLGCTRKRTPIRGGGQHPLKGGGNK